MFTEGGAGVKPGKCQVSTNGGLYPRWRRDGKELFFNALDGKPVARRHVHLNLQWRTT